jgi:lipoyl-dependent peroxiredoxin subunit D
MASLEELRNTLPDSAKDIKLNLQAVLRESTLSNDQKWGVAVASAAAARHAQLLAVVVDEARREVAATVIDDGLAAAALMAMNNVYYRFRHMIGKASYSEKPARLRMNRLVKPATNKTDFELFSLAVSAINGCEMCLRAHEHVVIEGGLSEEQIHDAVRIAATLHACAVSLEIAAVSNP